MMGSEQRQRDTFQRLLQQKQQQQQKVEDKPKTLVRRLDTVEISSQARRLYEQSKENK